MVSKPKHYLNFVADVHLMYTIDPLMYTVDLLMYHPNQVHGEWTQVGSFDVNRKRPRTRIHICTYNSSRLHVLRRLQC